MPDPLNLSDCTGKPGTPMYPNGGPMIEGPINEMARAFAQLLVDDGLPEEQARARLLAVEDQDWFWQAIDRIADRIRTEDPA